MVSGTLGHIESLDFIFEKKITPKILLTIPVTVASGECSFSKLKMIKSYLRNIQ